MQRVYLLLRSNQQSGPFTLEELASHNLKPFDLIWIEGKSAGWYYPQEIQALHPYLTFLQPKANAPQAVANPTPASSSVAGKKVFVAMPTAVQQPAATYTAATPPVSPLTPTVDAAHELKTTYTKPLEEAETDYMNWVYEKKRKRPANLPMKPVLAACLLGTAVLAGWWLLKPAEAASATAASPVAVQADTISAVAEEAVNEQLQSPTAMPALTKKRQTITPTIQKQSPTVEEKTAASEVVRIPTPVGPAEEVVIAEEQTPETTSEPSVAEAPAKKKKLREKILDLFKKKPEEAKPAETEEGQRQSTRREAGSNLAQLVTVRLTVPNDWMMGVKGAKAMLTNRSSETIATASVEVVYYNDDNEVLTKRTIQFHNIKSKGTATTTIPDHATATRLEHNVLSAVGAGEPMAVR